MTRALWIVVLLGACGDNLARPDAAAPDVALFPDAPPDVPAIDAPPLVRVNGTVDYNGPLAGAKAEILDVTGAFVMTDGNGNFSFDAPVGSRLLIEVTMPTRPELVPMIRGVVVADNLRPRVFYLVNQSDLDAASALGVAFDSQQAIAQIDFRNAAIAGYGATLTAGGVPVVPGFGLAFDTDGAPQVSETTVAGGNGSTLTLGNLAPQDVTFGAVVPSGATLPCQPRDANPLPLRAGKITWFDFECGTGTD